MRVKLIITGDPNEWLPRLPRVTQTGVEMEWQILPVLSYSRLPVAAAVLRAVTVPPPDWIIFCSPRAVEFWTALCVEYATVTSSRIGAIGFRTQDCASRFGVNVDLCPESPGSEAFLESFNAEVKGPQRILIPQARGGREYLSENLERGGHRVHRLAIYESLRAKAMVPDSTANWGVFTSPSSYDAFRALSTWMPSRLAAIGRFTADRMKLDGWNPILVPGGNIERIDEIVGEFQGEVQ